MCAGGECPTVAYRLAKTSFTTVHADFATVFILDLLDVTSKLEIKHAMMMLYLRRQSTDRSRTFFSHRDPSGFVGEVRVVKISVCVRRGTTGATVDDQSRG